MGTSVGTLTENRQEKLAMVQTLPDKQRNNSGNLKLWKPGQSGNPAGRPRKADCLTSLLKDEIEKVSPTDEAGRTWKELVVLATIQLAIKGHPVALREVWERLDGKMPQAIVNSGESVFKVVYDR